MSGFELNVEETLSSLRKLLEETAVQSELHQQQVPHFPVSAAGRAFGDRGSQMAAIFAQLHRGGEHRLSNLESAVSRALEQVEEYGRSEKAFTKNVEDVDNTLKETTR